MLKINSIIGALGLLIMASCSHQPNQKTTTATAAHGHESSPASAQALHASADWSSSTLAPKRVVVLFAFDQAAVGGTDQMQVRNQARYLLAHPKAKIRLVGHTDERGSREYNVGLGWRRAQAVVALLQQYGVPKRQFDALSYGAEKPVMLGHNEVAFRQNRRVELTYKAY